MTLLAHLHTVRAMLNGVRVLGVMCCASLRASKRRACTFYKGVMTFHR